MDEQTFLTELAQIVEVDALTPDRPLTDGNWDSVAIMSTIALIDEHYGISLSGAALSRCTTPAAILDLIRQAQAGNG
jgi:acyl carrier protein